MFTCSSSIRPSSVRGNNHNHRSRGTSASSSNRSIRRQQTNDAVQPRRNMISVCFRFQKNSTLTTMIICIISIIAVYTFTLSSSYFFIPSVQAFSMVNVVNTMMSSTTISRFTCRKITSTNQRCSSTSSSRIGRSIASTSIVTVAESRILTTRLHNSFGNSNNNNNSNDEGRSSSNDNNASYSMLFDRFIATCPADISTIKLFDPTLITNNNNNNNDIWVAVYRSNNNQPSVFIRDEFFQAMRSATTSATSSSTSSTTTTTTSSITTSSTSRISLEIGNPSEGSSTTTTTSAGMQLGPIKVSDKPVAVARLRHQKVVTSTSSNSNSNDMNNNDDLTYYILDNMRCILKKEKTDTTCDGGSEHTEAIGTAIDTLLHHYLTEQTSTFSSSSSQKSPIFENRIRTKATLISAPLLLERGFVEVTRLQPDMITHVSNYDACFERYASRSIVSSSSSITNYNNGNGNGGGPSTRQRAIDIVSQLSRIDRNTELNAAVKQRQVEEKFNSKNSSNTDSDEYDPWAGMKQFF